MLLSCACVIIFLFLLSPVRFLQAIEVNSEAVTCFPKAVKSNWVQWPFHPRSEALISSSSFPFFHFPNIQFTRD